MKSEFLRPASNRFPAPIRHDILLVYDTEPAGRKGRRRLEKEQPMIFSLDIWLLPAIAAASSSYLVSLSWERFKNATAPTGLTSAFLAALSFIMGAISSYYRSAVFDPSLENNVIVMFVAGASTTYLWLRLRKRFTKFRTPSRP